MLKQDQFTPLSLAEEVVIVNALTSGQMDDVPVAKLKSFETELRKFLGSNERDLVVQVQSNPVMTTELAERVKAAVQTFKDTVPY